MAEKPRQEDENPRRDDLLRNTWVRLAIALGIPLTVALLVALGFLVWWYFTSELSITGRKDLVQGLASAAQALAVFLTGVAGLIGLIFTWRNLRQTREHTERQLAQARKSTEDQLQQARQSQERTQQSAQATLRLTEQGQITERFTKAIEQLGNDKLEIRLGGIYALERIAVDSLALEDSPGRDYATIMEVLTAYVRENTPRWPLKPSFGGSPPASDTMSNGAAEGNGGAEQGDTPARRTPPPISRRS